MLTKSSLPLAIAAAVTGVTGLMLSFAPTVIAESSEVARFSESVAVGSNRVDNLRLHRVDAGKQAGNIMVAGRLDHHFADAEQQVRVRLTLRSKAGRDSRSVLARKVFNYDLPARFAPQNMPIRWVLTDKQTSKVDSLEQNVFVVVDIWQHDVAEESVKQGSRHSVSATKVSLVPMPALPQAQTTREAKETRSSLYLLVSSAIFRGSGITVSMGEDDQLALYVSQIFGSGWEMQPAWATAVPEIDSSSGPGSGYIDANGDWSMQSTMGAAGCGATDPGHMASTGQFVYSGGALNLSWSALTCPFGMAPVEPGSASDLRW